MLALDTKLHTKIAEHFSLELELVNIFHQFLKSNYNNSHLIERELNCDFGIADLVLFKTKRITNNNINLSLISPDWAYSLRKLTYRKIFSTKDFSQLTNSSINSSQKALKEFSKAGYCEQFSVDTWRKNIQPTLISDHIISFEAKLKNWKRAIWQACRYKTFSNESWVILDYVNENPAVKNIQSFIDFNIGLASVTKSGEVRIHHKPKPEQHHSDIALWKANALIAKKCTNDERSRSH
ncbi:hypothetical protein [Acerihabitans arboris]|uniref:Uncharacterized protein n=1 Tax=Acerihabitans arboris TaxID=2691583 RepID=A0A845STS3_9GAMM|nr:hypothetical protein [Acerihabitans arboris]NDL65871.1 hypothetical protein [Acerihabitans arboris]